MSVLFKMALRNIFRNRRRSLITLSAVSFGLAALIFLRSFMYGAQSQMVRNITRTLTSDAQIVPRELENIYNTNATIEDPEAVRRILRADPRVEGFAERVIASGIVSSSTHSMATFIIGSSHDREMSIRSRDTTVEGRPLQEGDEHAAIIGRKMRSVLGVELGDKIVVTTQDYFGAMAGEAFRLVGTFETGNDQIDNGTVLLLAGTAQRMLSLDQRVSKFALKIRDDVSPAAVVRDLRSRIQALPGMDLRVLTWQELIPMMAQLIQFQNGMLFVVVMIVLTVVAAGILNTLMMSIIERVREFGLMMAMGTRPAQIIFLVVTESLLLTTLGSAAGFLLGIGTTLYFSRHGIDLTSFVSTFSNFLIGSSVFPRIDWNYMAIFVVVVFVANGLVSFYPAWRASRMEPVEAMRQAG